MSFLARALNSCKIPFFTDCSHHTSVYLIVLITSSPKNGKSENTRASPEVSNKKYSHFGT